MSAQEGTTAHWYQIRVVTESETHYSAVDKYTQGELEELYRVLDTAAKVNSKDGASFSFSTDEGEGQTFIPTRLIRYITVLKVDPPE